MLKRNSIRLAEVWLDDYAKYYYQRIGNDKGDFGDISERVELRNELQCKSFKWYLDTVYPELFIPGEAMAHGEVRDSGLTFLSLQQQEDLLFLYSLMKIVFDSLMLPLNNNNNKTTNR